MPRCGLVAPGEAAACGRDDGPVCTVRGRRASRSLAVAGDAAPGRGSRPGRAAGEITEGRGMCPRRGPRRHDGSGRPGRRGVREEGPGRRNRRCRDGGGRRDDPRRRALPLGRRGAGHVGPLEGSHRAEPSLRPVEPPPRRAKRHARGQALDGRRRGRLVRAGGVRGRWTAAAREVDERGPGGPRLRAVRGVALGLPARPSARRSGRPREKRPRADPGGACRGRPRSRALLGVARCARQPAGATRLSCSTNRSGSETERRSENPSVVGTYTTRSGAVR